MAHQHHRGRYHPSRINGILKFNVCLEVNRNLASMVKKGTIKNPLNLTAPDWSIKTLSSAIKSKIKQK